MDGKLDNSLPNCAIMDNYYVDKPVWMVDLGKSTNVNGVIVHTWQGAGQGKIKFLRIFFLLRFLLINRFLKIISNNANNYFSDYIRFHDKFLQKIRIPLCNSINAQISITK